MSSVEVSQMSFPAHILALGGFELMVIMAKEAGYSGVEMYPAGRAGWELVEGRIKSTEMVGGVHQSFLKEKVNPQALLKYLTHDKDTIWPTSFMAWGFWVIMRHRIDSLEWLNSFAEKVKRPDLPTVIYPSKEKIEVKKVQSKMKLVQPKIEVAEIYGIDQSTPHEWNDLLKQIEVKGYCYDSVHSSLLIPPEKMGEIRENILRLHLSFGRTDREKMDRTILSVDEPILRRITAEVGNIPRVVETGLTKFASREEWVNRHGEFVRKIQNW